MSRKSKSKKSKRKDPAGGKKNAHRSNKRKKNPTDSESDGSRVVEDAAPADQTQTEASPAVENSVSPTLPNPVEENVLENTESNFFSTWIKPHYAFILILLVQTLVILAFSAPLENAEKSIINKLSFFNSPPAEENRVEIVDINDDDRRTIFNGKNDPLDPQKLYKIVRAIAGKEPKLIGIDIDTSHEEFKDLEILQSEIPIVWAETPVIDKGKILGTREPVGGKPLPAGHYSAVPASPKDSDNVQRFYQRYIKVGSDEAVSFPAKIISFANPEVFSSAAPEMDFRYISFVGKRQEDFRPHISANDILGKTGSLPPLKNKIVLLGGSFSGQDRTQTPVGEMLGVDVLATIIETELAGGGRTPLNIFIKVLFVILTSIGLLLIFHLYKIRSAILWSLLVSAAVAVLIGLIFQDAAGGFVLFGAFLLSLLSQIIDKVRDSFKEKLPKLRSSEEN